MIEAEGRIVVLNFRSTCFLPTSFFNFVLFRGDTILTNLIAKKVHYPESTQLNGMLTASYGSVPYGTNEIGEHILPSLFLWPLFPYKNMNAQVFADSSPGSSKHEAPSLPATTYGHTVATCRFSRRTLLYLLNLSLMYL